jgi:hypothetical protein
MYPRQELNLLARKKALLLGRIHRRREVCAEAAVQAVRPIAMLDRGVDRWRRLSPLVKAAAVPIGFVLGSVFKKRASKLRTFVRWAPIVLGAVRGMARSKGFSRRT